MPQFQTLPPDWRGSSSSIVSDWLVEGRRAGIEGKIHIAMDRFAAVLALDPDNIHALVGMGAAAAENKIYADAERYTRKALSLEGMSDSDRAICYNNLGFMCYARRQFNDAIFCLRKSIDLDPFYKMPVVTMGAVLTLRNELHEAYEWFERASLMNPTDWEPMVNRGILQLLKGDWHLGLPGYEQRRVEGEAAKVEWPVPRWNGEPLNGRAIIIWPDQGIGDCIWAHRLVSEVARTAKVYLQVYPLLENVLPVPDGVMLVHAGESIPELHYHVPLMSLPYCLRVDPLNPPPPIGLKNYRWTRHDEPPPPRIGLCWAGNIHHKLDDLRSIAFSTMARLKLAMPADTQWFTLQHDIRPSDAAAVEAFGFENAAPQTFEELASIIADLDLVITVDTGVLHVAAEMGARTWGLIPFAPDFRWGQYGSFCPWYPSLTLWRNAAETGGWENVIKKIATQLAGEFGE